jgi:hypothetical protein
MPTLCRRLVGDGAVTIFIVSLISWIPVAMMLLHAGRRGWLLHAVIGMVVGDSIYQAWMAP